INEPGFAAIDRPSRRAPRIGLHDIAHLRRGVQHLLLERKRLSRGDDARRHSELLSDRLQLSQALIADEEERFVLDDGPADRQPILPHAEWRDRWVSVEIEVVEVPRVKHGISEITECGAVKLIRSRLCNYIDLATRLCAVFRIVQSAVDAV